MSELSRTLLGPSNRRFLALEGARERSWRMAFFVRSIAGPVFQIATVRRACIREAREAAKQALSAGAIVAWVADQGERLVLTPMQIGEGW